MRSNKGFMLVQVLISAGIMAVLGLALAGIMNDMWKETSKIQNKNNEMMLAQALRAQVATPVLCVQSLVNKSNFNLNSNMRDVRIKLNVADPDSEAVRGGSVLSEWGGMVSELQMRNVAKAVDSFGGSTIYVGDLVMTARPTDGQKIAYKTKSLGKIFVKVEDATNNITSCYGNDSANSVALYTCEALGGDYDTVLQRCDLRKFLASLGQCPERQMMNGFSTQGNLSCTNIGDTDADGIEDTGDAGDSDPKTSTCSYTYSTGCPSAEGSPAAKKPQGCCKGSETANCVSQFKTPRTCGGDKGTPVTPFETETFTCTCVGT